MGKILAVCGVVLGLVLMVCLYWMSCSNKEVRLRNQIAAQQEVNKAVHDTTWRILQEKAGVTNEYKTTFMEVYPKLMAARYQDRSKLLMQFVKESNPNFDTSLYKDLMVSIEAERKNFLREQKKLRDLKMEHDNMIDTFPSFLFVGGRQKINVIIVTSTVSEEVFDTGRDDNSLYPKR
jgi:hypothetical protein